MHPDTRALILERATAVWLDADIKVLADRVDRAGRRDTRPLLIGRDPLETLTKLAETRNRSTRSRRSMSAANHCRMRRRSTRSFRRWRNDDNPDRRCARRQKLSDRPRRRPDRSRRRAARRLQPRPAAGVVTDETVAALHLPRLATGLGDIAIEPVVLPPGEADQKLAQLAA